MKALPPSETRFPSDADRKALHLRSLTGLKNLGEVELWNLHAYRYAFRRVVQGTYERFYDGDTTGEWFAEHLVNAAEKYYRQKLGRSIPTKHPAASSDEAVRTDWRQVPAAELTTAEHKIADPLVEAVVAEAQKNIAIAIRKWKDAFREKGYSKFRVAPERPAYERAAFTPDRVAELNAKLGYPEEPDPLQAGRL